MVTDKTYYEHYQEYKKVASHIDSLLRRLWEDTAFSSSSDYSNHKEFQELVAMGAKIVPYVVFKMAHDGADWTHMALLHELTGENPIPESSRGNYYRSIEAWLAWYLASKYYTDDRYHNLI